MKLDARRVVILALMGAVIAVSYVWLQGLFDGGDLRKAVRLVHEYRAGAIDRAIEARHAGELASPVAWEAEILSGFWGHVRVHGRAFLKDGRTIDYQFDTNLSDSSIHPGNDPGKEILLALHVGGAGSTAAP